MPHLWAALDRQRDELVASLTVALAPVMSDLPRPALDEVDELCSAVLARPPRLSRGAVQTIRAGAAERRMSRSLRASLEALRGFRKLYEPTDGTEAATALGTLETALERALLIFGTESPWRGPVDPDALIEKLSTWQGADLRALVEDEVLLFLEKHKVPTGGPRAARILCAVLRAVVGATIATDRDTEKRVLMRARRRLRQQGPRF